MGGHGRFRLCPFCYAFKHMHDANEIIKTGALSDLTGLLKRLAGPSIDEVGAILADQVKVYRLKNLLKTAEKTKRILEDAGVEPQSIPSRYLLPILDTCSVEDNDDLQERWAGLLASASQEADSLSPSYIETLKQLTPKEAKHFDYLFLEIAKLHGKDVESEDPIPHRAFTKAWEAPDGVRETYERLGLVERDYRVKVESGSLMIDLDANKIEDAFSDIESAFDGIEAEVEYQYVFTAYAVRFRKACCGPRKGGTNGSNP